MNVPDNWVILKIKGEVGSCYYKVLAGWSGGYLDSDTWQLNSGIKEVIESEDYYDFIGHSGSVYRCRKACENVRGNIAGVLSRLEENDRVELVPVNKLLEIFK